MKEPFRRMANRARRQQQQRQSPLVFNFHPKYREMHIIPLICLGLLVSLFIYVAQGVLRSIFTKIRKVNADADSNCTGILVEAVLVGAFLWGYLKFLFVCEEWCRRNRNERRSQRSARRAGAGRLRFLY